MIGNNTYLLFMSRNECTYVTTKYAAPKLLVFYYFLIIAHPLLSVAGIPGSPAAFYHFLMDAASRAIMSCPVRRC